MDARFSPGDTVAMREVFRGQTWALRPMTIVRDDEELAAFWLPRGTSWKRPVTPDGARIRLPSAPWTLADDVWARFDVLQIVLAGAAHAVWANWNAAGEFCGWYVNLQTPLRRTGDGFEYFDHALDVVIAPDRRTWHWKDEEELAEGVAEGVFTAGEAAAIREEGERALAAALEGRAPFTPEWSSWRPDPSWAIPALPIA